MMLLIGMKMSFTKKPMKPMIAKPMDVACAIFENSARVHGRGGAREPQRKKKGGVLVAIWRTCAVWLGAALHEAPRVADELRAGIAKQT